MQMLRQFVAWRSCKSKSKWKSTTCREKNWNQKHFSMKIQRWLGSISFSRNSASSAAATGSIAIVAHCQANSCVDCRIRWLLNRLKSQRMRVRLWLSIVSHKVALLQAGARLGQNIIGYRARKIGNINQIYRKLNRNLFCIFYSNKYNFIYYQKYIYFPLKVVFSIQNKGIHFF